MSRYICIHGHFYQPPRENAWLEEVELQDSAYPYHDWNARITAECYAPNTASRILDPERRIISIVNNYSKMSFNFGPTLLTWMERNDPEIYRAILEADRLGRERFSGHGPAIAQAYNHIILPLANSRDKRTQMLWGIRDFEHRFERAPEGMWLAETAVDIETLELLAEYGIRFTILAPRQAKRIRKIGEKDWQSVEGEKIDPRRAYKCPLPSGREIALFFYDGPVSKDIAFNNLLDDGTRFAERLLDCFDEESSDGSLVHVATDGETYGHHHRHGDMGLAYCLYHLEHHCSAEITVYGEYLEKHPPEYEVDIFENSSWSCVHGVERWRSNCGCCSGTKSGWNQEWRAPLRGALDWLRDNLERVFEDGLSGWVDDPWAARDDYIRLLLDRSPAAVGGFFADHVKAPPERKQEVLLLKLMEIQRHAMLMYTSCGWFFDEISGIETMQVLQYAARAIQLAGDVAGIQLEDAFVGLLERAPSNITELQNGAEAYRRYVKPSVIDLLRVGVHYAVSSLFRSYSEEGELYSFRCRATHYEKLEMGVQKMALGTVIVESDITRESREVSFTVLHLGDHNLFCGAREYLGEEAYSDLKKSAFEFFHNNKVSELIRLIDRHFRDYNYSLWHLFRDDQRDIINQILESSLQKMEASARQVYDHSYPMMQSLKGLGFPAPRYFVSLLEFMIHIDLVQMLKSENVVDIERCRSLVEMARKWSIELDRANLSLIAGRRIETLMEQWAELEDDTELVNRIIELLDLLYGLDLDLDLWKAQNLYYFAGKRLLEDKRRKSEDDDTGASRWLEDFSRLGDFLKVRLD